MTHTILSCQDIEIAIMKFYKPRINIIVPNVSWGLELHECDLLIVSKSGYASEIEIKTSIADLKKDKIKSHKHASKKIDKLYFAIPEEILEKALPHIPERAGIYCIETKKTSYGISYYKCNLYRPAKKTGARKLSESEIVTLLRLSYLRYYSIRLFGNYNKAEIFNNGEGI